MENLFLSPTLSFNANCHLAKSPSLFPVPFFSAKWSCRQFKSIVPNSIYSRDKDDVSIPPLLCRPESKFSITKPKEVQGKGEDKGDGGQLKEKMLYLESIGVDSYRLVGENKQISSTSLQSIMSVVKLLQSMGIDQNDIGRLVGMCPEALTLAPRQIRAVFTFLLREAKVQLRDIKRLIGNAVERAKAFVEEQKQEWTKFGCTILSDGWTDGKSRTIINFLACCNDNVVFLKSIDASNKVKNAQTLALMLENMVLEIGIENVVQIITDNAAAYVSAGKLLQQRHPTLSWTPCAAHVLDLLLEDMGKLDWVTPIVEDARRVTKYIYNHPWVLSLMREHTDGKEIVRPAVTRFATIFLTLQSILDNLASLKQMFVSKKWLASTFSKKSEGANVLRIVFDKYFEDKANEIVKVSEPLVGVLRLVDGDQTPMGELYEAMDKAKESVKNYYKGESIKYEPIWQIIDRRWNNQLHQPIHAAGYFLNPRFRADGTYADPDGEVIRGLSECVEKMVTSEETRDKIIAEQEIFTSAGGKVFSTSLCKRARLTQTPVAWWTTWGASTPNLAKFALRILSQPCSASHCERNWSLFEAIHTKKRNRLSQKRMNDMVYVQYNLKLRMKKAQQDPPGPIDLDEIDPYYDWTAQERAPLFTQEDISNLEREAAEEAAEEEGGGTGYDIDLDDIEEGDDEDDDIELTAEDLDILRAANVELPTSSSIATPSPALAQTQTRAQTLRGSSSRALPSPALASKATGKRKM